jgi:hypothetical protein
MLLLRIGFALALVSACAQEPPLPPRGAAAWVYDNKSGVAEWAPQIAAFNGKSAQAVNTVFSYGGDMEYYPKSPNPFNTYFPAASKAAAALYNATSGVSSVVLVIDGEMDGGQSYSPDLSKLTDAQLNEWADVTASVYCSADVVDGIQLDLEPFAPPYAKPFLVFLTALSANLRSPKHNCVNARHPGGRSITTFMFAGSVTPAVWKALGPNGFLTVSGYDLSNKPAGTCSTVDYFRAQLAASLADVAASAAAHNGSFFVGVPAAASAHEFESFALANGTVVACHPQIEFITAALEELAAGAHGRAGYLGPALWGFCPQIDVGGRKFHPSNPFSDAGEEAFLAANL